MTIETVRQRIARSAKQRRASSGTSILEVLVAFSLLASVLAFSAPAVIRHGRVLASAQHYRLAFEELSNQLERLTAMPEADVRAALDQLAPSSFVAAKLPGAELKGKLEPADIGQCLTLEIVWDEPGRRAAPVKMAAWLLPDRARPSGQPEAEHR